MRGAFWIALRDLRAELRGKEAINSSVSFALVILLIFSFSFEPTEDETRAIAGGLLWIAFAFAGALVINRSFGRELPNDTLDVLLASPVSGAGLFLGKAVSSFVLLVGIECLTLPVFGIFYNVAWWRAPASLALVLVLGTWALAVLGVTFASLTVNVRLRELMLPLLLYPALAPALIASIQLTTALLTGGTLGGANAPWLRLLVGFDVIFTALAVGLVEFVWIT